MIRNSESELSFDTMARDAMRRAALLIGMMMAANAFAADPNLCFAFLRGGNVVVSCEGSEFLVGETGGVNSFAIAEEQSVLAIVNSWHLNIGYMSPAGQRTPGADRWADIVRRIDFKAGKVLKPFSGFGVPTLMSTCGSLFGVFDPNHQPTRKDLLTGTEFQADPYTWFRCSADRKVVVGIGPDRALYAGSTRIAASGSAAHYEFNVSPNGRYVAYASDRQPLCVWSADGGTQCAPANMIDTSHDLVSVRDDGDVLVAMTTADKCVFHSAADYKLAKPNDKKASNCIGIGQWRAGMGAPEIVEAVGREPQWISSATASLLREWVRKSRGLF